MGSAASLFQLGSGRDKELMMLQRSYRSLLWITAGLAVGACSTVPQVQQPVSVPYSTLVGAAALKRVAAYEQNGYQVETDQVAVRDSLPGALVTVRSADGSLYAILDTPEKKGVWRVDAQGAARFIADLPDQELVQDYLPGDAQPPAGKPASVANPYTVDVLMGYSKASAQALGDPVAHALAQVAYVNLLLSNSLVSGVSLALAGVQIVDNDFPIESASLLRVSSIFSQGMAAASPDIVGAWSAWKIGGAYGWGYVPGRYTLQTIHTSTTFAHEVGHNIGGSHCNTGQASYAFGYNNGRSASSLCGKTVPYYSNPQVIDAHGLPLGNSSTADMARVWRENVSRMAGYAPSLPGSRLIVASIDANTSATLNIPLRDPAARAGVIVSDSETNGPRELSQNPAAYTQLVAQLADKFGHRHAVVLRAERITVCSTRSMEYYEICYTPNASIALKVSLLERDNPSLVGGMLTGVVKLRARDFDVPSWQEGVSVLLSVNRPATTIMRFDNSAAPGDLNQALPVSDRHDVAMVAMDTSEGPTELSEESNAGYEVLRATLTDATGAQRVVSLRGAKRVEGCPDYAMNSLGVCFRGTGPAQLHLSYLVADNPALPRGTYEGTLQLALSDRAGASKNPLQINLKIAK